MIYMVSHLPMQIRELLLVMVEQFSEPQTAEQRGLHKQAEQQNIYMVSHLLMQIRELLLVMVEQFSEPQTAELRGLHKQAERQMIYMVSHLLMQIREQLLVVRSGAAWWEELTGKGGEGIVIKPFTFTAKGKKGLVQPALKCRGREYLRIIYGAEYTTKHNLDRLRSRSLGTKRSLAIREFALGIEALERFVRKEPLRRVHECVFGVLALESEPVDPRL